MTFVTWQVDVYPYNGSTWAVSPVTLTHFQDPMVRVALGDTKDSFSFKLTNFNDERLDDLAVNDRVIVYRAVNSLTVTTSNILMVGTVGRVIPEEDGRQDLVRVEGNNFSETIMSAIAFSDSQALKVDDSIQDMLASVSLFAPQFGVTWHPGNPDTKTNGDPFPVVGEKFYNKPIRQSLEKLSTQVATGDTVPYYWYVNLDNQLVWRARDSSGSVDFNYATDQYREAKATKDLAGIKNFVIIKGGVDPKGVAISTKYYDAASINKHRARYTILVDQNKYALNMHLDDCRKAGVQSMVEYTFGTFVPTWTSTSYSSLATYNNAFREFVKERLKELGREAVENTRFGKLNFVLERAPGTGWVLGQLVSCVHPYLGTAPKVLRVKDIQYSTTGDNFTLEEDLGTI